MKLILIIVHIAACVGLILIVLLQRGKGASMGAAFGGSSQTVFGTTGATSFMHKVTVAAAVIFMLTSLGLAFMMGKAGTASIMKGAAKTQAPVTQQSSGPTQPGGGTPQK